MVLGRMRTNTACRACRMSDTINKCECECHGCGAELANKHHWLYYEDYEEWDDLTEEDRAEYEANPPMVHWCMQCVIESGMAYPDEQHCHADECLFCEEGCPDFIPEDKAEDYGITIDAPTITHATIAPPDSDDSDSESDDDSDDE